MRKESQIDLRVAKTYSSKCDVPLSLDALLFLCFCFLFLGRNLVSKKTEAGSGDQSNSGTQASVVVDANSNQERSPPTLSVMETVRGTSV